MINQISWKWGVLLSYSWLIIPTIVAPNPNASWWILQSFADVSPQLRAPSTPFGLLQNRHRCFISPARVSEPHLAHHMVNHCSDLLGFHCGLWNILILWRVWHCPRCAHCDRECVRGMNILIRTWHIRILDIIYHSLRYCNILADNLIIISILDNINRGLNNISIGDSYYLGWFVNRMVLISGFTTWKSNPLK